MNEQFDNYSYLIKQAPATLYKNKIVFVRNGSTTGQGITYVYRPSGFYYSDGKQWILQGNTQSSGTGTVTSVDVTSNATAITITGNPITTAGTINLSFNGLTTDYVDGTGALQVFPTSLGTVTSVDLTMPSAFAVAGNPVTTSGTLAVTGAGTTSQYVRGDGTLANFPTSTGGASISYYLNGSINQGTFSGNTYYQMSKTPVIGAGTNFTIATNGYISQFITDANDPSQLNIPSGNWNFEMYFQASSSGGSPSFYVELYKWDGATFTLIASSSTNPEGITNGTAVDLYTTALAVPATTLALTDRLAVRIYVNNSGRTITLHTEDNNLCQVITTFSTGITALNGLTAQVQTFATGTTGTDFGISSSVSTHTFNLPTASALNRGALSSADWTTFNNKGNGTVTSIATAGLISGGTITSSGTITTSVSTNKLIGRATAGTGVMEEITLGTGLSFTGTTLNVSGVAVAISTLTAAAATNTIDNTNYLQEWQWNTLTSGTGLKLSSTATGATGSTQKILEVAQSGANSNINQITYGLYVTNVKTGTGSLNHAAYFSASGGSGGNAAIIARNGSVVIGTEDNSLYSTYPLFIQGLGGPGTAYSAFFQGRLLINATNNSGIVLQSGTSSSMGIIGVSVVGDATFGSNTITFLTTSGGTTRMALNANLRMFGAGIGTSAVSVISLPSGTAPTTSPADCYQVYSADVVAGNAAAHYRTENGDIVKIYSIGGWGTPTGTLTRTTFATYAGATAGVLYDQTIMQNLIDAAKITSERLAALISDLKTGQQLLKA